MTTRNAPKPSRTAADSRQRFIDAAVRLFTEHSFAGTSLQMIADELGVTKAAVYHHFRTREELLTVVVEPMLNELRATIATAEAQRTPTARAEHMLTRFTELAVRNRTLIALLAADAGAIEMLRAQPDLAELVSRQFALLADLKPGPVGQINAAVALAGIAGAAGPKAAQIGGMAEPVVAELDDDTLGQYLIEAGRRALGLRAPRRQPRPAAPGMPVKPS